MLDKKINIVIINSVPINGGDEALLKATMSAIHDNFRNVNISVLCNNPILYKTYLPEVNLYWDWEYSFFNSDKVNVLFKIKRKIRYLLNKILGVSYNSGFSKLLASRRELETASIMNNADFVISSAGGYFHDFYGYDRRLTTLEYIHNVFKKPYYIFYQSVGPFWETKKNERLKDVFDNARKIIIREAYSLSHLKGIDYHCNNVAISSDIAFYLNKAYSKPVDVNKTLKKIAINFRAWTYEKESENTLDKAVQLCQKLLNSGYELSFISTCQGVPGYTDDTEYIQKVISKLDSELQDQIKIDNVKLSFEDFLEKMASFDAYIGMRLHGAILSLIAGIPVLNIAYEDKSLGIFEALELEDCSFSFKENIETWFTKVDAFVLNYNNYLNSIEPKRLHAQKMVADDFKSYVVDNETQT